MNIKMITSRQNLRTQTKRVAEEIESKRLAPEEILSLPKFKVPGLENFK
jgi:hypothetical protein